MMRSSFRLAILLLLLAGPHALAQQVPPEVRGEAKSQLGSLRMVTREFSVPWLMSWEEGESLTGETPADPLVTRQPQPLPLPAGVKTPLIRCAQERLEGLGVRFPSGASASLNPFTSRLSVTNTVENLDMVEALVDTAHHSKIQFVAILTVIRGPGPRVREVTAMAAGQPDAAAAQAALLKNHSTSGVCVVGEAFLNSFSGTAATSKHVLERHVPAGFALNNSGQLSAEQELLETGLDLRLETLPQDDGVNLSLTGSLELNPAPPTEESVSLATGSGAKATPLPLARVPTLRHAINTSIRIGGTVLLGVGKPPIPDLPVTSDILWASFLTVHRVAVPALPLMQEAQVGAQPQPVAPGLRTVAVQVPAGMLETAMKQDHSVLAFLERHGIAPTAEAQARAEGDVLTLANTPANIERTAVLLQELVSRLPHAHALTLHTVRGQGAYLRRLAARAAPLSDHKGVWAELQEAMAAGQHNLQITDTTRMETRANGENAKLGVGREHVFLEACKPDKARIPQPALAVRDAGISVEFSSVSGKDPEMVQVTLNLERHTQPPKTTASTVSTLPPVTDFRLQHTTTSLWLQNGRVRLISLTRPSGLSGRDILEATFAQCDVIPLVGQKPWAAGCKVMPAAAVPKSVTRAGELYTRTFRVVPDFISDLQSETSPLGDPFARAEAAKSAVFTSGDAAGRTKRKTIQQILEEEAGISFPPGSAAYPGNRIASIIVRNTSENLDKAEAFINDINKRALQLPTALTIHVIEAPAPRVRQLLAGLGSRSDHRTEFDQLLKAVAEGKARSLASSRLVAKAGDQGVDEQGVRHSYLSEVTWDGHGGIDLTADTRLVGLRNEANFAHRPSDANYATFTTRTEFHTAPPVAHGVRLTDPAGNHHELPLTDFHVLKLAADIIFSDGTTRLLAAWKPGLENEDQLQVMFVTCDIVRPKN